jgi:GNAT superfamily N-acetyltransferase
LCIRPVEGDEGERLREIAIAAKAHWGYDLDRVKQWAAMGDFSPIALRQRDVYVAAVASGPVGWAAAVGQADAWWLDDLWITPQWMGKGIGSRLFEHVAEQARAAGAHRMEWEAEPNALGFYERMGGRWLRESEPSVWGRVNPIMGLDLL